MPGIQGKKFTEEKIARVKYLLAETELTTQQIAFRMGSSQSAIIAINRKSHIRRYNGKRSHWETGSETRLQAAISRF